MESDSRNFKKQSSKQLAFGVAQVVEPWAKDPKEPGSNLAELLIVVFFVLKIVQNGKPVTARWLSWSLIRVLFVDVLAKTWDFPQRS